MESYEYRLLISCLSVSFFNEQSIAQLDTSPTVVTVLDIKVEQ